jgi:hypothetical protein
VHQLVRDGDTVVILVLAGIDKDPLMVVSGGVDVSFMLVSRTGAAASVPVPAIGHTTPVSGCPYW